MVKRSSALGILFCLSLGLPTLRGQSSESLPPVHWLGSDLVFTGGGPDWPARMLTLDQGNLVLKRSLGWPKAPGHATGPAVICRDQLFVFSWAEGETPEGPKVSWTLHGRGLKSEDGWKLLRDGQLPRRARVRALLPLEQPDTFLLLGWLYYLEPAKRVLPVHRVKFSGKGDMEILESLNPEKDALVQALQLNRSAMGSMAIHSDPDGRWVLLCNDYGIGWVLDAKGNHRHTFTLSAHVTPDTIRKKMTPLQVVLQAQPSEDGKLWIQARNEHCLEAAALREQEVLKEQEKSRLAQKPTGAAEGVVPMPPVTELNGDEPWRKAIDEVIRRNPRLRWIEFDPATGVAKDMSTAPFGGADSASSFAELMEAARWVPTGLGRVVKIPDALMPWGPATDLKKEGEAAPDSKVGEKNTASAPRAEKVIPPTPKPVSGREKAGIPPK